ncbi:unnamed protein product, partial [marine sediment metagenome]
QWSNGIDETTNLNNGAYTAIPIFTDSEPSNFSAEFTKNSRTQVQVNFTGAILMWANVGMQSSGTRVMITARAYKNSVGVGPLGNACYIRNSGSGDSESASIISPSFYNVTSGDTLEIRTIRTTTTTSTTTFYGANQNFVTIMRVA